jgi:hypothetical protein
MGPSLEPPAKRWRLARESLSDLGHSFGRLRRAFE